MPLSNTPYSMSVGIAAPDDDHSEKAPFTDIAPNGDLDARGLDAFVQAVDRAVSTSTHVRLDLSGIDFLSIPAAAYIWMRANRSSNDCTVEITGASAAAAHALAITGFGGACVKQALPG